MAAQVGRAMVLQIGDGTSTPSYDTIATVNSKTLTLNNSPIDVTTPDLTTPGGKIWMETLAGVVSMAISADGRYKDQSSERRLVSVAQDADPTEQFRLIVPDLGIFQGRFRIESLDFGGTHDGEVTFSISLTSTGEITFATSGPRIQTPLPDHAFGRNAAIQAFTLPAATGGTGTVTYSMAGLPTGLAFNAGTRTVTGTPTDPAADYVVSYTATDSNGVADTERFTITLS